MLPSRRSSRGDTSEANRSAPALGSLRHQVPEQHAAWVRWAVRMAACAYAVLTASVLAEQGIAALPTVQDFWVLLVLLVALALQASGRVLAAALLGLGVIWAEMLFSFFTVGMRTASLAGMPGIVVAVALLVGARPAAAIAVASSLLAPLAVYTGLRVEAGPGFLPGDYLYVAALVTSMGVVTLLLRLLLASYERVLRRSRDQERQLQHAQKMDAVGQLAGGVAHDFNNLLTVVSGYADLVSRLKDPRAAKIAHELHLAQKRGAVLTRQLLTFARHDIAEPSVVDLGQAVREMRPMLENLVREEIRLELSADEVCPAVVDPGQFEQVIMNLVSNGRDAMNGSGTLRVRCSCDGSNVVIEVSDTGSGMSSSTRQRIFEPFFTTKQRGKGTGLGLSTVHGIVAAQGGRIAVASELDVGTTFRVELPRSAEEPPTRSRPERSSREIVATGLILLAEDDDQARRLVVDMLEDAGFEVVAAQNGAEALALAVKLDRAPSLLLSDVVMPGMTGVELLERMRRHYPRMPFLLMSGYTDDVLDPRRFDVATDLLAKPFERSELLDRIMVKLRDAPSDPAFRVPPVTYEP